METISFNPTKKLFEEGKWLIGVTSFECTNSVFNMTNENHSFSITIPGHWETRSAEKTIDELNNLLELRSHNSIELHVEKVRIKGWNLINDLHYAVLILLKLKYLKN